MPKKFIPLIFFCVLMISFNSMAQPTDSDIDDIASEIEKMGGKKTAKVKRQAPQRFEKDKVQFSDLSTLAPFEDVSVIQKRYLPKTKRFQVFGAPSLTANDAFFFGRGLMGKFGYYTKESVSFEATYLLISSSERDATKDLRSTQGVNTSSFLTPKSYMGVDFVWTPFLGKMTLLNQKIVPFDIYLAMGFGITTLEVPNYLAKDSNGEIKTDGVKISGASTLHVAAGQIYAISRNLALRLDFSINNFTIKVSEESRGTIAIVGNPNRQAITSLKDVNRVFNNVFINVGVSYFFPEAGYR